MKQLTTSLSEKWQCNAIST